jgi:hypothetical protein
MPMGTMSISRSILFPALFLLVCAAAPAPSEAQIAGPCSETVAKVCKDVIPGGGRIMKCLNDHRDDQSIACKDWVEDQQKSMQELMAVCPEDIARWCGAVPPNKASIYYCLLDNSVSLRLDCRSKLGEIRDRLK